MAKFSPQQLAVIEWVRSGTGSAFVEAVAGSGKTTTLIGSLAETEGSVAFCAYNKKIADEVEAKVAKLTAEGRLNMGNRLRIGTFHKFGYAAVRRIFPRVKAGPQAAREKADMTARFLQEQFKINSTSYAMYDGIVTKLISLAKQRALGLYGSVSDDSQWYDIIEHFDLAYEIENPDNIAQAVELAQRGLQYHNNIASEIIDFDDMIYQPLITNCRMWQNDWVLTDEGQDTNPARRALARKMLLRNGRAMFVGDRHQGIYGFTGADADAIDQIVHDFNCVTLPLTVSFRCPKTVVEAAQRYVSHIQAAPTAADGVVRTVEWEDFAKTDTVKDLRANDAILCRKTAPLVDTAFMLIRQGVACHVEGKDIGVGLLKLVDRFRVKTVPQLIDRLDAYAEGQVAKLIAKGRETQAEALQDRVDTIKVLAQGCPDAQCVRDKISAMFLDGENEAKPTLTLSTVHRSKGREWDRVFVLGQNAYMPSKWARQQWQIDQENNLIYVAYTRAMQELVLINVPVELPQGRPDRNS